MEALVSICTLIIPIYNEENRFSFSDFEILLSQDDLSLLVIDDGSSDFLPEILEKSYHQSTNLQILRLTRNVGKAEAIRQGFLYAIDNKGDFIGVLDGDFSYSAHEFLRFFSYIKSTNFDVLSGVRTLSNSKQLLLSFRLWQGISFRYFINIIFLSYFRDIQCGLKIFRSDSILKSSVEKAFENPWLYDLEILLRNKANIHIYGELRVDSWQHKLSSKLSLKHVPRILFAVLKLRHYFGTLAGIKLMYFR
jgi:dolichyl-phosphate beta-glucosyltransferase